jgi:hypothetical protein
MYFRATMSALKNASRDGSDGPIPWTTRGQRVVEPWQPYAGLVYFHLLLDGLSHAGALEAIAVAAGKSSEGLGQ